MRKIVICVDGTSQRPKDRSNVWRLYDALPNKAHAHYQPGVGALTGRGMRGRLVSAYEFLARKYRDGDEVYLFGFSRGAAAVRSLANMVHFCGLVHAKDARAGAKRAILLYEKNARTPADLKSYRDKFDRDHPTRRCSITVLGVWDTVLHVGLAARGSKKRKPHRYHRMQLDHVERAYQALAIDERRRSFLPISFDDEAKVGRGVAVTETWFAGMHSDIGGKVDGPRRLSNIALTWMCEQVQADLNLKSAVSGLTCDPLALMRKPGRGFKATTRTIPAGSRFHDSVFTRKRDAKPKWEPLALKGVVLKRELKKGPRTQVGHS